MSKTILIVDDAAINRLLLRKVLSQDYTVLEAEDGIAALEVLLREEQNVSAVLLDIVMPGMDGYEVLRRMREHPALMQIPVIMVTGSDDDEARMKSLSEGANDFIMKPYKADIVLHCLETNIALVESSAAVRSLMRDRLTGLYNREPFFEQAQEMVSAHEPGYYIMACFDVDNFKVINDQYGTQRGDAVLRHIADVFRDGFVPNGGLCCRVFADNFAVLYPASFQESPEIEQIRLQSTHVNGLITPIIFSIGRYIVDDLSLTPSAMYDRANLACDSVKGRYDTKIAQYDESMRESLLREQEIVSEMERALETRQFEVWFQPQYNHSTYAMIGAEALVRWRHPQKGLIPPGIFIPVFEKNGFVYSLDKFVWREVCRYLRKWLDVGRSPLPVSVNISRFDILRPDVVQVITGLVAEYELPIELLRLEVTESAFSESAQRMIDVVKELTEHGFTVEIDDFGSGYSSLNTLKDVPAQIVKLDMKFLERSSDSQRGGNIVESVVRMAKWLGMAVIAEGVETLKQANYLRSIGCSYIQGYLYAKPMPVDQYETHCTDTEKEEHLLTLETVENLNNNSFWDPDSMDTLIFNSYVGGACIYEYHNGKIEMLRATEKYAEVVGSAGMTVEDALKLNWEEHLDEAHLRQVVEALETSVATNEDVSGEYVFFDLPGCPHETYLRTTMRVIASAGDRYLVYCTNENITAQREAEKREREVAEEMRLIMANVSSGICASVYEPDGLFRIIFANDRFFSMYGYTREQVDEELGGNVLDIVHPDDLDKTMKTVEALLRNRGSVAYEYRCIKRDGTVITVRCANTVTSFAGVGDTVLLSVVDDVTERTESEQKISSLMEQLSVIMNNISGGVTASVLEGDKLRLLFANAKHYEQLGHERGEYDAPYNGIPDMILPCDKAKAAENLKRVALTREPCTNEYRIRRADGAIRWFRSNVTVIDYPGETAPVHLAVTSDVTEQVEAEQQIHNLSERLQAIMDNVDLGIIAAVVEGDSAKYVFANDRYYAMLGYTKAQFQNEVLSPFQTIAPEDRPRIQAQTARMNETGEATTLRYYAILRDGSRRFFRAVVSIGRLSGIDSPVQLSIVRDVTEERETALREQRAGEQLNAIMRDVDSGLTATILKNGEIETLFSNEQFYRMRGYTKAQYRSEVKDYYAVVHPDDAERVRDAALAVYTSGKPNRDEYRIILRDHSERWVRVNMSVTHFTGVEQPVVLSVYSDVTTEKNAEQATKEAMAQLQGMMDDMPGGFCRMRLAPGEAIKPVYINDGFCQLIGMSHDEVMAQYANDAMAGVHPDDVHIVNEAVEQMLANGEAHSSRYRLLNKNGEYAWLSIFGRATRNAQGEVFLSIYYTDAAKQVADEEKQKALLDNLPSGAGVYELSNGQMNLIYQNRSYWELVGLEQAAFPDPAPMSAIHPDDIPVIMRDLLAAIQEQRDVSCNIRLRHLTHGFRPVHLAGRVFRKNTDDFLIYATFTLI